MQLNDYQKRAREFAVYPDKGDNIVYPALGLSGESGEVANQVKKVIRDDGGRINSERRNAIVDELGDCLWYIANEAQELGVEMETLAFLNLRKLTKRAQQDAIHGDKRSSGYLCTIHGIGDHPDSKCPNQQPNNYFDGRMPGT